MSDIWSMKANNFLFSVFIRNQVELKVFYIKMLLQCINYLVIFVVTKMRKKSLPVS